MEPRNIDLANDYYSYLKKILKASGQPANPAEDGIDRCQMIIKKNYEKVSKVLDELDKAYKENLDLDRKYKKYISYRN